MTELGTGDFKVKVTQTAAELRGVFRLPSPRAYDEYFNPIELNLAASSGFTVDLVRVAFLNSSGIMAISRIVLLAKKNDRSIAFRLNQNIPWQQKTFETIKKLWEKVTLEYVDAPAPHA